MMKLNFVTLENGNDYLIIEEKIYNNIKYLYLVNENDDKDFCIRKVVLDNGIEKIIALENDEEFNIAIKLFNKD